MIQDWINFLIFALELPLLKALGWANVRVDIHNEGVTDALVLTYLNLASSIVCQKQSNVNASQGVLYTALIGFGRFIVHCQECFLYTYTGVGLSALYQRCTLKDDISYLLPT